MNKHVNSMRDAELITIGRMIARDVGSRWTALFRTVSQSDDSYGTVLCMEKFPRLGTSLNSSETEVRR